MLSKMNQLNRVIFKSIHHLQDSKVDTVTNDHYKNAVLNQFEFF